MVYRARLHITLINVNLLKNQATNPDLFYLRNLYSFSDDRHSIYEKGSLLYKVKLIDL